MRQVTVTCGVCVLLQLLSGPPQVWRMQPEKVVRHDDTGRERRLGISLAGSEKGLSIRAVFVEARNCKVEFPCRGRLLNLLPRRWVPFCVATGRESCTKAYSAPCPAEWFAFNGGMSCSAPSHYSGVCLPVQLKCIFCEHHKYRTLCGKGSAWAVGHHSGREDNP